MTYDEAYKIAQKHSDLPVIIDGPHAPTGKSTLCAKLRAEGRIAYEQWELEQSGITLEERACLLLIIDEILPALPKRAEVSMNKTPIPNEVYWQRVRAQREKDDPAQDPNWRLLEPIGTREQVDAVCKLMEGDKLTKLDIALILVTFKLDPGQNISVILPPKLVPEHVQT